MTDFDNRMKKLLAAENPTPKPSPLKTGLVSFGGALLGFLLLSLAVALGIRVTLAGFQSVFPTNMTALEAFFAGAGLVLLRTTFLTITSRYERQ